MKAPSTRFKAVLEIAGGFLLLLAAIPGWFLPFLPGWALFIAGLAVLSRHFHWARRAKRRTRQLRLRLTRAFRGRKLSQKPLGAPATKDVAPGELS